MALTDDEAGELCAVDRRQPYQRPAVHRRHVRGQDTPEREGRAHARPDAVRCNGRLDRRSCHAITGSNRATGASVCQSRLSRSPAREGPAC